MIGLVIITVAHVPGDSLRVTVARPEDPAASQILTWNGAMPQAYVASLRQERQLRTLILVPDAFFELDEADQRLSFDRALQEATWRQLQDRPWSE